MKKFILYFLLLSYQIIFAQTGWIWQNPLPQGNNLNAVKFINQNTGWVAGEKGMIIKTTNGGNNWDIQYDYNDYSIFSLFFNDENTGFATTFSGVILRTTNGGNNWNVIQVSSNIGFYKILFKNQNTGWLTGYGNGNGRIFLTTNAGINWVLNTTQGYDDHSNTIMFLSDNIGYIGGGWNLYKTTNGGNNWYPRLTTNNCSGFYFFDTSNAIIISGSYIYKTSNAGVNYSLIFNSGLSMTSMVFPNPNIGYISCDSGKILKTTNFGVNWYFQSTGIRTRMASVDFLDTLNGWCVGDFGMIAKTTNGGINWNLKTKILPVSSVYKSYFLDENTGILCANGKIMKTTDGGWNWNTKYDSTNTINTKIQFLNSYTGYALYSSTSPLSYANVVLYKTTNRGENWSISTLIPPVGYTKYYDAFSTYFINEMTGWLACAIGYQYPPYSFAYEGYMKTTNGGANWTEHQFGQIYSSTFWADIIFENENTGLYITNSGIKKTTDGGNSWSILQNPDTATGFSKIFFLNSNTAWAVSNSHFYKTTNGCQNWSFLSALPYSGTNSLFFIDTLRGWTIASVNNNPIYATSNGGINWVLQYCNTNTNLNSVFFINQNTGWVVGENATIIKTTSGIQVGIYSNSLLLAHNYFLNQNYPNPFNASTKINFELPKSAKVKVIIYDILGRKIEELINSYFQAGQHTVNWNAYNYSSGVYFYRIETSDFSQTKKCILLK